ncbi:FkbM family methyltransferase [Arcobacter sp. CECT 8985]|uniref:FkbM family methyltransferase n=1 Tax=Arcobacter sp. CECT 8985 TaxID=1935424 RepID=UPI00100BDF57|nr:FkbM family methyltransferase [Arcobacter sp. CECT 8985]RXJ87884.1 methyltransferase [Arcobacter sp. CECT 8985]
MIDFIPVDYINKKDKELVAEFFSSSTKKKFILGINKYTKCIQNFVQIDGIIDDFTRVQSSRKKSIYKIDEVPKDALILSVSTGSPLEVKNTLDKKGFKNINYLSFYKYSKLDKKLLAKPPFITDFEDDFKNNKAEYEKVYNLLCDEKSKEVFKKVISFKISFDFDFMTGFTNNHKEQYFDKELIPNIKDIVFLDGGSYVGDTIPQIISNFPDFKKIYCIEPNKLHINIAKKNFSKYENIEFINCGLGNKKIENIVNQELQNNCEHDYQAININTIDNLINEKVDFIKLDIEGAEQDALIGVTNTIKKYQPILAICIYHKAQDWYKIPKIILDINPNYKIYLRHYMEGIFETVMYFIPIKN